MSYVRRQRLSWARIKLSYYSTADKLRIAVSIFEIFLSMYIEYYLKKNFSISLYCSFLIVDSGFLITPFDKISTIVTRFFFCQHSIFDFYNQILFEFLALFFTLSRFLFW